MRSSYDGDDDGDDGDDGDNEDDIRRTFVVCSPDCRCWHGRCMVQSWMAAVCMESLSFPRSDFSAMFW